MSIRTRLAATAGVLTLLSASVGVVIATPAAAASVSVTVTSAADGPGTCPSASNCTLRQALTDSNPGGPNDAADAVITIAPGLGTITLGSSLEFSGGADGTHSLTLVGNGATIAGDDTFRLLSTYASAALSIDGLTFTDGSAANGGAIYVVNASSLSVTDSTFSSNVTAGVGGAVFVIAGDAEFVGVTFSGNSAVVVGGAAYLTGNARFTDVTFSTNSSREAGALYTGGDLTLIDTTFTDNVGTEYIGAVSGQGAVTVSGSTFTGNGTVSLSGFAGALYASGSSLTISDSEFTDNSTTAIGGAVVTYSPLNEITGSRFSDNSAVDGGAIWARLNISVTDSEFTGNTAANDGGAMKVVESLAATGSTFTDNTAARGGAVFTDIALTLTDTTFTDNSTTGAGGAVFGSGDTTITGSTFTGNSAVAGLGGGALYTAGSSLTVSESDFSDNTSGAAGGAIVADTGTTTTAISASRFTDNSALTDGALSTVYAATITDSTFTGNSSTGGGGAGTVGGALQLAGSTLADNISANGQGAFFVAFDATIVNSTFTANVGGGRASTISANTLTIAYSTFTDLRTAGTQYALESRNIDIRTFASVLLGADTDFEGTICNWAATSSGYNHASDTSCGLTATGDVQDATETSTRLGALTDNGGPTPTRVPLISSPLVGAIPHATCTTGPVSDIDIDQRGYDRPNLAGGPCDIGAVQLTPSTSATVAGRTVTVEVREFTSTVTVTINSDPLVLGTISVDESGSGTATYAVPCSVEGVNHEIVATASGGEIGSTEIELLECEVPVIPVFTG